MNCGQSFNIFMMLTLFGVFQLHSQERSIQILNSGWKFTKGNPPNAAQRDFDDAAWETVTVPHDWAIYGPFDKEVDKQVVAITQNEEQVASEKTGRTG